MAGMGLVRKSLSVATLGVVSFRSKKEKLRRSERSRQDAEALLEHEHAARVAAEARIADAKKRVKVAIEDAAHARKQLDQSKRRERRARKAERAQLVASAEPIVRSGVESARHAGKEAAVRGRRARKRARKAVDASARKLDKSARRSMKKAKATASATREQVAPAVTRLTERAGERIDQLTNG